MKFKENSIFTKTGRLQRRINRTEKFIKFLNELEEDIDSLIKTCDSRLEELKMSEEKVNDAPESEIELDEDIDTNDPEFDFIRKFDKAIEDAKANEELNEEDEDGDDAEECECDECTGHVSTSNSNEVTDKYEQEYGDDDTPTVQKIIRKKKTSEIKRPMNKKVVVNKPVKPRTFLNDEHVKTAMRVMVEDNVNLSQTLYELKEAGIELTDDGDGTCLNKDGSVALAHGKKDKGIIDTAIFRFKLTYVPHGNQITIFNQFINELGLHKVDPAWKSAGLDGKACMVKIDDETIAVNMNISGNVLYVTFVYNVN